MNPILERIIELNKHLDNGGSIATIDTEPTSKLSVCPRCGRTMTSLTNVELCISCAHVSDIWKRMCKSKRR